MHDVFVNVAGGLKLDEPAVDLGVACAIASAYKNRPADEDAVLIGEVGLGGEVRSVGQLEKRANEAQKLGFKRVIGPFAGFAPSGKPGIEVATVKFLSDAVGTVIH
jgi:DNA repair protein RadA/Sms